MYKMVFCFCTIEILLNQRVGLECANVPNVQEKKVRIPKKQKEYCCISRGSNL
jgi:hypothetical protein